MLIRQHSELSGKSMKFSSSCRDIFTSMMRITIPDIAITAKLCDNKLTDLKCNNLFLRVQSFPTARPFDVGNE